VVWQTTPGIDDHDLLYGWRSEKETGRKYKNKALALCDRHQEVAEKNEEKAWWAEDNQLPLLEGN
jgi:hypothetical protein